MRLVCRECSAAYEAPDTLFGAQPREVRCNRCGFQWTVVGAVKAMPGATTQASPPAASPAAVEAEPKVTMPPELIRAPEEASLRMTPQPEPVAAAERPAPEPPAPVPAVAAGPSAIADQLAGPLPDSRSVAPAAAPHPPSTRTLLERDGAVPDLDMGDPEERRLSHELSFGEVDHRPGVNRPVRRRRGGLWLLLMIVIVLIVAAVLFEPQILSAVPGLHRVYSAVGL
ncbi:zinc-ribbon domain-containing protein [Acidisoma sp. 7E03]